jgi:hypothetical protein
MGCSTSTASQAPSLDGMVVKEESYRQVLPIDILISDISTRQLSDCISKFFGLEYLSTPDKALPTKIDVLESYIWGPQHSLDVTSNRGACWGTALGLFHRR